MLSRENRVILGSFLLFAVSIAGIAVADQRLDVRFADYPLVAFLVFAGLTIVGPQLYLARTDTNVDPPRSSSDDQQPLGPTAVLTNP